MSEIKNGRLVLYGAEHSKCNHMIKVGFKGLMHVKTEICHYRRNVLTCVHSQRKFPNIYNYVLTNFKVPSTTSDYSNYNDYLGHPSSYMFVKLTLINQQYY